MTRFYVIERRRRQMMCGWTCRERGIINGYYKMMSAAATTKKNAILLLVLNLRTFFLFFFWNIIQFYFLFFNYLDASVLPCSASSSDSSSHDSCTICCTRFSYSRLFSLNNCAASLFAGLFGFGSCKSDFNHESNIFFNRLDFSFNIYI